jgi:hypothetical protein
LRLTANVYYDIYNNGGVNFDVMGAYFDFLSASLLPSGFSPPSWLKNKYNCDCDNIECTNDDHNFWLTDEISIQLEEMIDFAIKICWNEEFLPKIY